MSDGFDERRLRSAMEHEARRARPDPRAWEQIMDRTDIPRWRNPAALGAAAAVIMLIAVGVAVAVWPDGDGGDVPVVVEPPDTTSTTPTTATTQPEQTTLTTGTTQPEGEVVFDPIDMGPTPPTRDEPPETFVAVLPDGRLVVANTATGDVIEEVTRQGDLRDRSDEGVRYGIWQVAVSPDGRDLWYSFCCEPAAGRIDRWSLDGPNEHGPALQADNPWITMSERWVSGASYAAVLRHTSEPVQRHWFGTREVPGMSAAVLSPDGTRMVIQPWDDHESGASRPMLVVDTQAVRRQVLDSGMVLEEIVDEDPEELPNDRWMLPAFRRDGLLLVAGVGDNGTETPILVDIDTGALTDPGFTYGDGVPVMQRYDGSGEWLLAILSDDPDAFPATGRLVWFGPDGQTGTIPGEYVSAAW